MQRGSLLHLHLSAERNKSCFPPATNIPTEFHNFWEIENSKLRRLYTGRPNTTAQPASNATLSEYLEMEMSSKWPSLSSYSLKYVVCLLRVRNTSYEHYQPENYLATCF